MVAQLLKGAFRLIPGLAKSAHYLVRSTALSSDSSRHFVIETNGWEFAVWSGRVDAAYRTIGPMAADCEALSRALTKLEYSGQPATIVLHPPCVCLKSFQIATEKPNQWLASHILDISPPGNRRDQVISYLCHKSGQLLIAFARKTFVSELREILQKCDVSVKCIFVGGASGANSGLLATNEQPESMIDFTLCSYEVRRNSDGVQIFPITKRSIQGKGSEDTELAGSNRRISETRNGVVNAVVIDSWSASVSNAPTTTSQTHQLDFLSQFQLPRALPMRPLQRVLRAELWLLIATSVILLLHLCARSVVESESPDSYYMATVGRLNEIQKENDLLSVQLHHALQERTPRFAACNFLKTVALATPAQSWLTSITYAIATPGSTSDFSVRGFSLNGDDPLRFTDSLRFRRNMQAVALSKGSIVENNNRDAGLSAPIDRITKFEITGKYAIQ